MTVLLLLATFAVFIAIDWVLSRNKVRAHSLAAEPEGALAAGGRFVEGFLTPEGIGYHPGHTWVARERKNLFRIGVDEFAAALAGRLECIELPKPGQWIRQGQKTLSVVRNGQKSELVSPTEGEVVEINDAVLANPALLREDPYGEGWLMTVHVPDEESTSRNLVPADMVKSWMRNAVGRLYAMQPQLAGAVAADGGRPSGDLLEGVEGVEWTEATREFFLTK